MREQYKQSRPETKGVTFKKRGLFGGMLALMGIAYASTIDKNLLLNKIDPNKLRSQVATEGEENPGPKKKEEQIEEDDKDHENEIEEEDVEAYIPFELNESLLAEAEPVGSIFDQDPAFFETITENGDFSDEERGARTRTLAPGVTVFEDVGVTFYIVQKGDDLNAIRSKLSALEQYAYLLDQKRKLESFNIPDDEIRPGMLLPIPMRNIDRHLTDQQFAKYVARGILAMQSHRRYGKFVRKLLSHMPVEDLIATCIAVAKQEAGGEPIGQFENHRWEPKPKVFSFSVYHILMRNAGLKARRKLNVSEGQMYHPEIATKVFLAFLYEKDAKIGEIFPISEHSEEFASFYNGKGWREKNPNYATNVSSYFSDAQVVVSELQNKAEADTQVAVADLGSVIHFDESGPETKETEMPAVGSEIASIVHAPDATSETVTIKSDEEGGVPDAVNKKEQVEVEARINESTKAKIEEVRQREPSEEKKSQSPILVERRGQVDWRIAGDNGVANAFAEVVAQKDFFNPVSKDSINSAILEISKQIRSKFGSNPDSRNRVGVGEDGHGVYLVYESDPNDRSTRITVRV